MSYSPSQTPDATSMSPEQLIQARLLYAAYARKPSNLLMTAAVTVTIGLLLWSLFPPTPMAVWMLAITAATSIGYVECAAFRRAQPGPDTHALWQHIFSVQTALAGLAWASGPTLMIRAAAGAESALFVAILLCVCAVAMISVASQRAAMNSFIAAALVPPAVALWHTGGDLERMVAIALVFGAVLMMFVGHRFNQSMRELLEAESRIRSVFDTTLDAVIGMDAFGRITDWNLRAETVFGWTRGEALGLAIEDTIIPAQHRGAHRGGLARFLATGEVHLLNRRTEITAMRRNGEEFPIEISITPIKTGNTWNFTAFIADITARKEWVAALQESEERFRSFFKNNSSVMLLIQPSSGEIIDANMAGAAYYGYPRERLIGMSISDINILPPERVAEERQRALLERRNYFLFHHRLASGEVRDVEVYSTPIESGGRPLLFSIVHDITDRKRLEEAREEAVTRLQKIASRVPGVVYQYRLRPDGGACYPFASEGIREIYRVSPEDVRDDASKVLAIYHPDDRDATVASIQQSARDLTPWHHEYRVKFDDGTVRWLFGNALPQREADGSVLWHGFITDITLKKAAEDEINSLAFYDPLTRLPNRRLLLDRLSQALASSARSERDGALLLIDLDDFKTVNATLGHDIGDLQLQHVAQRLRSCVREGDTVARLGGDEFVVIVEDLSGNAQEAATQAEAVGEKILTTLNQPYQLASHTHRSSASIGVALFSDHHSTIDDLLKRTDLAMFQAKAAGRNTLRFFDPEMQTVVTTRAALEADLREAILKAQFLLHYQAQVVGEGRVTGAEVLLRWQHPQRGLVSPLEFIPLAEDTGLILPLGHWVLENACTQLALWATRPEMAHLTVAVNVSVRQFHHRDFVDQVLAVLDSTGANPKRLKLELTESLLVDDVEGVIAKMSTLKARGVGFSLDDFGTGYSSLSYLKRLPLDQLKIDQSFVKTILTDPNDAAIAKMVVALADSMGLAVIAEGVEIEAQRDFLARQGCHAYQGYLFSRPLPLAEFEALAKRI